MTIAITDANIFIDLIYVELLDSLFSIEMEIHTTLNVIDELKESQQELLHPYIKSKQLSVHTSDDFELPKAIQNNRRLSPSDKSVFGVALALDAMILTGDGLIRKTATTKKIETHGTLWLLDQFLEKELITKGRAAQQLKHLQGYNKRLPLDDCARRISEWS